MAIMDSNCKDEIIITVRMSSLLFTTATVATVHGRGIATDLVCHHYCK